ncbi:MAG: 3'(2'),5'-bisphosphate nucleotidase CysQ [Gammaproteobacteria bacterium]|nr:3'(2'),5'-bisphosphate nucleotidase CysQ [Gammaproteobacteria bacterium]MDD9894858.1 3'(2'),5'-bisphosphate nucleotidase CysQ [Gammaproteobacteria bacterium]MDD9957934.1 3'(2'),5'-bisphosphate nucleotidase CysQ [Gammaproteobacteria bacterium]
MWKENDLDALLRIAISAGKEILSVYERAGDIEVEIKDDSSPLTEADRRANELIVEELQQFSPSIPILSEESEKMAAAERMGWSRYWIVDPLDGTKEFIKRNGEFTVNIALISNGTPELGIVHVPVTGTNYLGKLGKGAWKIGISGEFNEISTTKFKTGSGPVRVVASRSHRGELADKLISTMAAELGDCEVVSMGSSLKICLLAEGKADVYPRLAPTSEWDTAAAHAVLNAAGGEIYDTGFEILRYNQKESLLNPHFIAVADPKFNWSSLLTPVLR